MTINFDNVYIREKYSFLGSDKYIPIVLNNVDEFVNDYYLKKKTIELAEIEYQRKVINGLLEKTHLSKSDISLLVSGDLQNQILASTIAASNSDISMLGIYSACASFVEGVIIGGMYLNSESGNVIVCSSSHNLVSEKIAGRVLPDLGFSKEQIAVIKKLVNKHDIFMFIRIEETSNSYWKKLDHKLIDQEVKELSEVGNGEKLIKHLVMVGRADNLAQNPKMTEYSLKMLDAFDKMLSRR